MDFVKMVVQDVAAAREGRAYQAKGSNV